MKMLCVFSINDRLKFIGHLDLMRAMQRALRRSGLPLRYSQGFNPHILLSFAAPLSVGMEGAREIMEVPLEGNVDPEAFIAQLNEALPPLIRCHSARVVDDSHPAPMSQLGAALFEITPTEQAELLGQALGELLKQDSIPAMRKSKKGMVQTDLRPLIFNAFEKDGSIKALLALSTTGTCKPDLFIKALCDKAGLDTQVPCRVRREALYTPQFVPLENA